MSEEKVVARVKSPSRKVNMREGRGFSLGEIKAAKKTIQLLKELGINIDYHRKSTHDWNIEALKKVEPPKEKKKKKERKPWVPKEKRIKAKPKRKKRKPTKPRPAKAKKEPKPAEEKLGELGVSSVQALCKENPEELAMLVTGVSEDRLREWIDEGKELIRKKAK